MNRYKASYSDKDEFLTKTNTQKMGVEVAQELHGSTWQDRYDWIMKVKAEGNE